MANKKDGNKKHIDIKRNEHFGTTFIYKFDHCRRIGFSKETQFINYLIKVKEII